MRGVVTHYRLTEITQGDVKEDMEVVIEAPCAVAVRPR